MNRLQTLLACLVFVSSLAHPQLFGKNKVQYKDFRWSVMKTEHFEVYFYEGEDHLARYISEVAESAYEKLEADFDLPLSKIVPIIVYNSHNDFEQTNVIPDLIEESVGGFTEIFKNRVVVPFTGSYGDLERVTTHELTHAFQFDILYGRGPGALIARVYQIQFPLWFAEGLAQFESKEWDAESDMILRDLTISEKLIPIDQLEYLSGSYLVYVEGESILRFVTERYGRKKVFELFHQLRTQRSMGKALQETFGLTSAEFDHEWQKWVKLRYWPLVGQKSPLEEYGSALTDHSREGSILNVSPALSPDGNRIAYISDRSGYSDLYVISALDGTLLKHLVKGERSSGFESIHIQRGGIGWSGDGNTVAFVAKSKGKDMIYTMDVNSGRLIDRLEFDLDGVYSPHWSPRREEICFVGFSNGASDLYLYDLETAKLKRLTNDNYDERDPSWDPTGELIAFSSDRGELAGKYAIFTMKRDGSGVNQVSFRSDVVASPTWSEDGEFVAFVSDLNGIPNLYLLDVEEKKYAQLTDALTGITSVDWVSDRLVFAGFKNVGWDLYILREPLEMAPELVSLELESAEEEPLDLEATEREVKRYGLRFTPDYMIGGVSYSSAYGFSGQTQIAVSDILGNHQIYLVSDLIQNIEESNFLLAYLYLPRRVDLGFSVFQQKYYYLLSDDDSDVISEREYGGACLVSYPLDRFRRIDLQLDTYLRERTLYEYYYGMWYVTGEERRLVVIPYLSAVYDNTMFGMTGPVDGLRANITYGKSIGVSPSALRFQAAVADMRRYWKLSDRYSFATRLVCAATKGRDAEPFWIGGSESVRGYEDYSLSGHYIGFINMELRCPFVDRFDMAFPLPIQIRSLRGVLFMDLAATSDSPGELVLTEDGDRGLVLRDLKLRFGAGIRFPISFFIIKLDFAKHTDLREISRKTYVHFSLGSDF